MIPRSILLGLVLPAIVAGSVLAVGWRAWRLRDDVPGSRWSGVLAVSLGYAAGHVALVGWPPFLPVEATHVLFYLVLGLGLLAGGTLALTGPDSGRRTWPRWLTWAAAGFLLPASLIRALISHSWNVQESIVWTIGLGTAVVAYMWAFDAAARVRGPAFPFAALFGVSGVAAALGGSGSALLGCLAGSLAAVLAAALLFGIVRPRFSMAGDAAALIAVILAGLWINGYFYAEAHPGTILLGVAAPLAALTHRIPIVCRLGARQGVAASVVVAATLAAAAVVVATKTAEEPGGSYYGRLVEVLQFDPPRLDAGRIMTGISATMYTGSGAGAGAYGGQR